MVNHKKFIESAQCVFSPPNSKYQASQEDIKGLAENIELLKSRGLGDLNQRLIDAKGHEAVFDTIAEHNFAVMLSRHLSKSVRIEYEPPDYGPRPVDFRFQMNGNTYCLQMKRFADLKIWNRQNNLFRDIAREAEKIKIQLFFDCELAEDFKENDVSLFVQFLTEIAPSCIVERPYDYPSRLDAKARVWFSRPQSETLKGLTFQSAGNMSIVDITGCSSAQIKDSIRKASNAFTNSVNNRNINLVIAEADKYKDIDIAEACFGTEQEVYRGGQNSWERQGNGIFADPKITDKVVGLIALRRINKSRPISAYTMLLYINEKHLDWLSSLKTVFPITHVVQGSMQPGSTGNF